MGTLNLLWPGLQAALWLCRCQTTLFAGHAVLLGIIPMAVVGLATLHFVVRVVVQHGIVAVTHPFRLRRKTWLIVATEIHRLHVPTGLFPRIHCYLDEHTRVELPCWGLSAADIAALKAKVGARCSERVPR